MSLKKFLRKHSGELSSIATVLSSVVNALPMDRQDKTTLADAIEGLQIASKSIGRAATKMVEGAENVDTKAIKAAVEDKLPELLGQIAERVFALAKDDAAGKDLAAATAPVTPAKRSRAKAPASK